MNKEIKTFVTEKTNALLSAHTCCQELKDAAKAWLNALDTDQEATASAAYVKELEEDIVTAEGLLAFAESEAGAQVFGDAASGVAAHARELIAAGAKYCDCPACAAAEAILTKKEDLLG